MSDAPPVDNQTLPLTSSLRPRDEHTFDNTGYCLLSLDGGGVRGLSTLYILRSLMERLNYMREQSGLPRRKPCEIFDLIGGTSTGGLIAIMLGHLEMTVDECIAAYTKLMKHVFEKRENRSMIDVIGRVKPRFSSKALEEAIARVVKGCGRSVSERFESPRMPRCKVFVCSKFQSTNTITRIRNYRTPEGSDYHPTIVEAALATSAAPTYFSKAAIEGSEFVDGAIGANNPAVQVEEEASDLWCEDTGHLQPLVKCFISVGTGHPGIRSVYDKGMAGFLKTLQKQATETEDTNQQFMGRWRDHQAKARCFRFNVDHGLADVWMAEHEQQGYIKDTTVSYLGKREAKVMLNQCVENLRTKEFKPTDDFIRRLREEIYNRLEQRPSQTQTRATESEIAELIDLGNRHLKISPERLTTNDLIRAVQYFSQALTYRKNDPSTSFKQVARLCQKLMETCQGLSLKERAVEQRREFADQAYSYGIAALKNAGLSKDECMEAQIHYFLACVGAWKVYLQAKREGIEPRSHPARRGAEVLLEQRLEDMKRFGKLQVAMEGYEAQARLYSGYLTKAPRLQWQ